MSNLAQIPDYPLTFIPQQLERIWGGNQLHEMLGKPKKDFPVGESWEISAVEGFVSVVKNGRFKGKYLTDLINHYPEAILGNYVIENYGQQFPLLIKFIDAQQDLSIQVHPNDELASQRHQSKGKEEMWYIMDAQPQSKLMFGFNTPLRKKDYTDHLQNNTLEKVLHYEQVSNGNVYHIPAGLVHAIGSGILLAEIQQSSDVTYRLYDYNRRDNNGNTRALHTELALDAIDFSMRTSFQTIYDSQILNIINPVINGKYFKTSILNLTKSLTLQSHQSSFTIYIVVEGQVKCYCNQQNYLFQKGETFLLPASVSKYNLSPVENLCKVLQVLP